MEESIYLDHNATTPVLPEVLEEMIPFFTESFGNSASHTNRYGRIANQAVENSFNDIANYFKCEKTELVFTSGATESINLAIKGVFNKYRSKGSHFITCKSEHKAVLDTFKSIEHQGAEVDYLSVDQNGLINLSELKKLIRKDTVMVSVMLANNETGVIQDIKSISEVVHENGSIMMSDITQCIGKYGFNLHDSGIDLGVFSAHKFYGPKGIGGLYVRRRNPRVVVQEQINGGGHQSARRSGTMNVPGIVGLAKAITSIDQSEINRLQEIKELFETRLKESLDVSIIGEKSLRLCNTSMVLFKGIKAERLITKCPELNMAVGSACTSASRSPSHVLKVMGLSDEDIACCIRVSFGILNSVEQIDHIIDSLVIGVQAVKN